MTTASPRTLASTTPRTFEETAPTKEACPDAAASASVTDAAVIAAEEGGAIGQEGDEEEEEVWGHSPSSSICGLEEDVELTPEELGPLPTYAEGDIIAALAARDEEEEGGEEKGEEAEDGESEEEGEEEEGRVRPHTPLLSGRRDGGSSPRLQP